MHVFRRNFGSPCIRHSHIQAVYGVGWCFTFSSLVRQPFLFSAACDSQCLTCETPGVCTSCRDPAKVLLFGECQYDSCAHQYYLNTTTRTCRGTLPSRLTTSHKMHWCSEARGINNEDMQCTLYDIHKLLFIHIACSVLCYIEFIGSINQVINCRTRYANATHCVCILTQYYIFLCTETLMHEPQGIPGLSE